MRLIRSICILVFVSSSGVTSFAPLPRTMSRSTVINRPSSSHLFGEFLKQLPGETDSDFMARLRLLAGDPEAFERAVREGNGVQVEPSATKNSTTVRGSSWSPTSRQGDQDDEIQDSGSANTTSKGYQRVEDWEHDQQEMLKEMSWEERVKFEGHRDGNRLQQIEILRKSINRW